MERCRSSNSAFSGFTMARRKPRKFSKQKLLNRESYNRVLIVCEGAKTEPYYFVEIRNRYRLNVADVVVVNEGSAPITVVNAALDLQKRELNLGEKFDIVFCVFDRDEHATYDEACAVAKANKLKLARSWPCFEFWLLLHFGYTRKPYARSGKASPADNCVRDLKKHIPNYKKGQGGCFRILRTDWKTQKRMPNEQLTMAGKQTTQTQVQKFTRLWTTRKI